MAATKVRGKTATEQGLVQFKPGAPRIALLERLGEEWGVGRNEAAKRLMLNAMSGFDFDAAEFIGAFSRNADFDGDGQAYARACGDLRLCFNTVAKTLGIQDAVGRPKALPVEVELMSLRAIGWERLESMTWNDLGPLLAGVAVECWKKYQLRDTSAGSQS